MILCANPQAGYLARKAEIDAGIQRVLEKGWFVLGAEVAAFEREFAAWVGVNHCVGVGSGTEALHLALAAAGVGAGDEVITVSHTAVATVAAIELVGARPVFVDIEPAFFTLSPEVLEAAITSRTRAIIPVHIYGQAVDLGPVVEIARRRGLVVIEDCAQAHGAGYRGGRIGTFGHLSCFSFYPTKNLGALGDGGAVVTDDPALAAKVRALREYGWTERYISNVPGWNSRLDELQAAVLRVKLRHLDADNVTRRNLAANYDRLLPASLVTVPPRRAEGTHVYHLYVVRSPWRDALQAHLKMCGVNALIHYPLPIHLQPAYHGRCGGSTELPETERAAKEILSLPLYPELTEAQQFAVVRAVDEFKPV